MTVNTTHNTYYEQLPYSYDLYHAPDGFQKIVILSFRHLGMMGNHIFMVCAAWFLCRQNHTKADKVIGIYFDAALISVLCLLAVSQTFPYVTLPAETVRECFFPVMYRHNWFITCYIVVYLIHGGINHILEHLNREQHAAVMVIMFAVYCLLGSYEPRYYYSEVLVFITVYMLVSYIRYYRSTSFRRGCILVLTGIIGLAILTGMNYLSHPLSEKTAGLLFWAKISNPFSVIAALGFFEIANSFQFHSRGINKLSSLSLVFYLLHENLLIREILRPVLWGDFSNAFADIPLVGRILSFSLCYSIWFFVAAWLYQTVTGRINRSVSGTVRKVGSKVWKSFYERFL